jgi:hypothetical protein
VSTEHMADSSSTSQSLRRRVHSINFELADDEWLELVVDVLREVGWPRAGRSEVMRVALSDLRRALSSRSRTDILKFFLDRDAERRFTLLASRTQPARD